MYPTCLVSFNCVNTNDRTLSITSLDLDRELVPESEKPNVLKFLDDQSVLSAKQILQYCVEDSGNSDDEPIQSIGIRFVRLENYFEDEKGNQLAREEYIRNSPCQVYSADGVKEL